MRFASFRGVVPWVLALISFGVMSPDSDAATVKSDASCPALLDRKFNSLQGKSENLCQYAGKVVLVVNTASYCGYTEQYKGLQAIYDKYKKQGLVVIGFPGNDFGKQEPGSNAEAIHPPQRVRSRAQRVLGLEQLPLFNPAQAQDLGPRT